MGPPTRDLVKAPVGVRMESSLRAVLPQHRGFSSEGREGREREPGEPPWVLESSVPSTLHLRLYLASASDWA